MYTTHKTESALDTNASQTKITLNDSIFDMFDCSLSEHQERQSPKRKQDNVLQAPQARKTRSKLALLKQPSQKPTVCDGNISEKCFDNDAEFFCTQMLNKIDQEIGPFQEKDNEHVIQGRCIYFSVV